MAHLLSAEERDEATRRRRLNLLCLALALLTFAGLLVYPLVLFVLDVSVNGWAEF